MTSRHRTMARSPGYNWRMTNPRRQPPQAPAASPSLAEDGYRKLLPAELESLKRDKLATAMHYKRTWYPGLRLSSDLDAGNRPAPRKPARR